MDVVERFRQRRKKRLDARNFDYGTASSGNWGHVGVLGQRGGSAQGGGGAFRIEKTSYKKGVGEKITKYTSQAKIRVETKAMCKSKSSSRKALGERRAKMFNMTQKSVRNLTHFDPKASKNILADKDRGRKVKSRTGLRGQGTREAMAYAMPNAPRYKDKKTGKTVTAFAVKGKSKKK